MVRQYNYTWKEQEISPTENLPPLALYAARDQKFIGMLTECHTALRTTARQNFSRAGVVCNDSKTGRKQEGQQGCTETEVLMKKCQNG
jgi:hypothetical protein